MSSIDQQNEIIQNFSQFKTWEERYKEIIRMGKELESMPEEYKTSDKLITGCQSQVWIHAAWDNGKVRFWGDSDAMIVKGLLALVLKIYNHQSPNDIISIQPTFMKELGLNVHLSPSRSNGLASMVKQIKLYAVAFISLHQRN